MSYTVPLYLAGACVSSHGDTSFELFSHQSCFVEDALLRTLILTISRERVSIVQLFVLILLERLEMFYSHVYIFCMYLKIESACIIFLRICHR